MKPNLARIERFVEDLERRLAIAGVIPPRWVKLVVDAGETAEGKIAAHVREHPTDAGCNFLVRTLCDGGFGLH